MNANVDPNDSQVGGSHYKAEYQHWDFVLDTQLTYLEGCATKYVARAYKKGGAEDLQKALHYLDKMEYAWRADKGSRALRSAPGRGDAVEMARKFCAAQQPPLDALQTEIIMRIVRAPYEQWPDNVHAAARGVQQLMHEIREHDRAIAATQG